MWHTGDITNFFADEWTPVVHDVTAYKNAAMRVRFGFQVYTTPCPKLGSWNIDDLLVSNQICP